MRLEICTEFIITLDNYKENFTSLHLSGVTSNQYQHSIAIRNPSLPLNNINANQIISQIITNPLTTLFLEKLLLIENIFSLLGPVRNGGDGDSRAGCGNCNVSLILYYLTRYIYN